MRGPFVNVGQQPGTPETLMTANGEGVSRNPYNTEIALHHLRQLDMFMAVPLIVCWYLYTSFWLSKLAKRVGLSSTMQWMSYVPGLSTFVTWAIALGMGGGDKRERDGEEHSDDASEAAGSRSERGSLGQVFALGMLHIVLNVLRYTHGYAVWISIFLWSRIAARVGKPPVLGMLMPLMFYIPIATIASDSPHARSLWGPMGPESSFSRYAMADSAAIWEEQRQLELLEAMVRQRDRELAAAMVAEQAAEAVDKEL